MRSILLAASLLATLGAPAFAAHHTTHAMSRGAAEMTALAPQDARVTPFTAGGDSTSPRFAQMPRPCIFGVACNY